MPPATDHLVELIHRVVGYPLAFIVAPVAIATFAGRRGHRGFGVAYVVGMTFLYLTGTSLTLTRHDWGSWEFGRNVAFNLLGYSMVLYGFRAMWLVTRPRVARPAALDRALFALLAATVVLTAALAFARPNTPLRIFAAIGIGLLALEVRDWRAGFTPALLYRRHIRYMLGSYFYVLTVVSLVHLRDELPTDLRWLWPSVMGLAVVSLVAGRPRAARHWKTRAAKRAILVVVAVAVAFGVYAGWEVVRDARSAAATAPVSRLRTRALRCRSRRHPCRLKPRSVTVATVVARSQAAPRGRRIRSSPPPKWAAFVPYTAAARNPDGTRGGWRCSRRPSRVPWPASAAPRRDRARR